jgi:hypothetical protein
MHRRALILGLCATVAAWPALARDPVDRITRDLQRKGYSRIDVSRTLLGRTRITAESASARREIIVDPRTGEILRDLTEGADSAGSGLISTTDDDDGGRGRGRGRGGDDAGDDSGSDDSGSDDSGGDDSGGDDSGGNSGDDSGGDSDGGSGSGGDD